MKRIFDVIVSALCLFFASPVFLVAAVLIRIDSKGPVFFRQERVGLGGRTFWILKFRSMVENAAAIGPYHTDQGDPRVTRVGALLRRTSLDELPQFLNVLKGDMSLVGPRPDVPEQRSLYSEEEWRIRHTVRPGITGLAQAYARSSAGIAERKRLDLEYVRTASLKTDVAILVKTVRQVVSQGGF